MRNSDSNPWKFDLHGLHAAEAVQALQEHLQKIETQLPMSRQLAPRGLNTRNGTICSLIGSMNMENTNMQCGFRQRPASLQVITGIVIYMQKIYCAHNLLPSYWGQAEI